MDAENQTAPTNTEANEDIQALRKTLSFLRSVILSGEPYTTEVSTAIENGYQRLYQLDQLLGNREGRNE